MIQTWIVREEGKHADRMTTTTTAPRLKSQFDQSEIGGF